MLDCAIIGGVNFTIECGREVDGRWIAEIALMSGVMAYGDSASEAMLRTQDAEQVAGTFEEIMDCIGLESSDGILNTWMYSFDPTLIKKSP
jgi:hypothetical protein